MVYKLVASEKMDNIWLATATLCQGKVPSLRISVISISIQSIYRVTGKTNCMLIRRDSEKQNLEKTELQSFTLTQGSVWFYSVSSETVAISNTIVRQYK